MRTRALTRVTSACIKLHTSDLSQGHAVSCNSVWQRHPLRRDVPRMYALCRLSLPRRFASLSHLIHLPSWPSQRSFAAHAPFRSALLLLQPKFSCKVCLDLRMKDTEFATLMSSLFSSLSSPRRQLLDATYLPQTLISQSFYEYRWRPGPSSALPMPLAGSRRRLTRPSPR